MKAHTPVDIFRVDQGGVLWLESAVSIDEAKARIRQLGAETSDEYVILDQSTNTKVIVKANAASAG